jgi:hypothetical protein
MNKAYLVTALLAVLTLFALQQSQEASSAPYSFEQYKLEYRKAYAQGEEEYRKTVFLRNLVAIHEHNANPAHSWKMGVNQFTDLTEVEFAAIHLTLKVDQQDLEVTAEPEMLNRLGGERQGDPRQGPGEVRHKLGHRCSWCPGERLPDQGRVS